MRVSRQRPDCDTVKKRLNNSGALALRDKACRAAVQSGRPFFLRHQRRRPIASWLTFTARLQAAGKAPRLGASGEDHLDYYPSTTKRVVWNTWKMQKQRFSAKARLGKVRAAQNAVEQRPAKQTQKASVSFRHPLLFK